MALDTSINPNKLGFGLMRLPMVGGQVDIDLFKKMVDVYIDRGFSYFDTSPVYLRGESEAAANEAIVKRFPRDKITLSTKLPCWLLHSKEDMQKVFEGSLRAFGTDYLDAYMLHGLSASGHDDRFGTAASDVSKADKLGAWDFLQKVKAEGKVRHIGFSYHDSAEALDKILAEHPEVDYVVLQINYLDWDDDIIQSRKCYEVARKHGLCMSVMEPLKGGTLVNLPPKAANLLKSYHPDASLASWGLRFVASLDGIIATMSGMQSVEEVKANTEVMCKENFVPLSDEERNILMQVRPILEEADLIKCTGCGYCLESCPKHIKIPQLFAIENNFRLYNNLRADTFRYLNQTQLGDSGKASSCIRCLQCERHCPQKLPITDYLKVVAERFEDNGYILPATQSLGDRYK